MYLFLSYLAGLAAVYLAGSIAGAEMRRRRARFEALVHTKLICCETRMENRLYRAYYVLGRRRRRADLALDFSKDLTISRIHALLWYDGSSYCIAPLRAPEMGGGTGMPQVWVNEVLIGESGVVLRDGDKIRMGQTNFVIMDTSKEG